MAPRLPVVEEGSGLPSWIRTSSIAWAGACLGALAIVLTTMFLLVEKRSLERSELASAEMFARVLQESADRTFDTVELTLAALAEQVPDDGAPDESRRWLTGSAFQIGKLPFLRSLAVIDGEGRVRASTDRAAAGLRLDLGRVPLPAAGSVDRLGPVLPGRDLIHASIDGPPPPPGRTFIPLVRRAGRSYVVAVLNPDFFADQQALTLASDDRTAAMLSADSTLLTATPSIRRMPGESVAPHPFLTHFFPTHESGSYIGAGIDGEKVVAAFRVMRKRAVLVVVERHYSGVAAAFAGVAFWAVGGCGAALAFIAAMTGMAWRSLRGHERVRTALESTRRSVAESERELRTLVESVHELIFQADADGRIGFVNARWQELVGTAGSALIGQRLSQICVEADRALCDELFVAGRLGDGTTLIRVDDAGGRTLTLEVSVSHVIDEQGRLLGFAGFAVDVTDREEARRSLEAQLSFTAQLLEVSPIALFVKDADGRFETVNRAWLDLMGVTREQTLGKTSSELFGARGPDHDERFARLLRTGEHIRFEHRLVVDGRPPKDTLVEKARVTRADGRPVGIVGSVVDVTEFRNAERETGRARDAAERANRAKSEFLANITHELRTPLQGIIGFSEIGAEIAADAPEYREMFDDIQLGGRRMLTLVNGLLDVALLESAIGSLVLEPCDLGDAIRDTLTALDPAAAERSQTIEPTGIDRPIPARIDAVRLRQALRNVVANAIGYGPAGGTIQVACRTDARGAIVVEVRDAGPGIPEDELERVFEAFVQSSRTSDGSGGTGLGLTIARKIMSAHGGSIAAANRPGGGTVVSLRLPGGDGAAGIDADRADARPLAGAGR